MDATKCLSCLPGTTDLGRVNATSDKLTIMNVFLQFPFIVRLELPGAPAGSIQHILRGHTSPGAGAQSEHSANDDDEHDDDHDNCRGHDVLPTSVDRYAQLLRDFPGDVVLHL